MQIFAEREGKQTEILESKFEMSVFRKKKKERKKERKKGKKIVCPEPTNRTLNIIFATIDQRRRYYHYCLVLQSYYNNSAHLEQF